MPAGSARGDFQFSCQSYFPAQVRSKAKLTLMV